MKKPPIRTVEIVVHRSKKNSRLGHAVATLFPCSHHRYLGLTLYKGEEGSIAYRTQDCKVVEFIDYSVGDKEVCKLCPKDDFWIDDLVSIASLDDFADILEVMEDF